MEPASQNKESHQPWKTEPSWDSQEWGRPVPFARPGPMAAQQPDCSLVPKALDGGDGAGSATAKTLKVESSNRHEEDGGGEGHIFQPKKKAIWKLLGSTSYPLVPKWASYQKESKGAYSYPGYRNHGSKPYQGQMKDGEGAAEAAIDLSKLSKDSVSKPKAVFGPMLNSLLTVKAEPIQESTQKATPNHCTEESLPGLMDDPEQPPMMTSMQSPPPPASTKPRGPYRAKVSPSSRHSTENTQSDSSPPDSPEAVANSVEAPSSSPLHGSGEKDLPSQSQKSIDQKTTQESRFLLIDDKGVPYTMMKREMESKPKEEASMLVEEKPPVPKKLHYCLVCFRTFLYLSDLERHSITHSEHKPFECKVCGKTFKRSSHLQRHKHIHTGERPFLCPICQKGFRESGELHRHQRVHTGEKPFQCELCHLRFTERNTLRRHIKRKHTLETLFQQDLSDWGYAFEDAPGEDCLSKDVPGEDCPSKDAPGKGYPCKDAPGEGYLCKDVPGEDNAQ